jgi:hypothetical protein
MVCEVRVTNLDLLGPPPPLSKAASRVTEPVVRIQDDSVDAVVAPIEQIAISVPQIVGHDSRLDSLSIVSQPELPRQGPLLLGGVPEGA